VGCTRLALCLLKLDGKAHVDHKGLANLQHLLDLTAGLGGLFGWGAADDQDAWSLDGTAAALRRAGQVAGGMCSSSSSGSSVSL